VVVVVVVSVEIFVVLLSCMFVVVPVSEAIDNNFVDSEDHHKATATLVRFPVSITACISPVYELYIICVSGQLIRLQQLAYLLIYLVNKGCN